LGAAPWPGRNFETPCCGLKEFGVFGTFDTNICLFIVPFLLGLIEDVKHFEVREDRS
jgi:hypothetical protein